ncbi:MAG: nuclear transport factor 2 family protein [Pseudomonadota bacterium]
MLQDREPMTLEQRVGRIEDVSAITSLKYRYAAFCDAGYDLDGLCSIFVPDGRWAANGYGDFTGHAQIRAYFAELAKTVADVLHYVTSPRIDLAQDGQSATGRFYLLCLCRSLRRDDPSIADPVVIAGTYEDQFVKIDGRWFFKELVVNVRYSKRIPVGGAAKQ